MAAYIISLPRLYMRRRSVTEELLNPHSIIIQMAGCRYSVTLFRYSIFPSTAYSDPCILLTLPNLPIALIHLVAARLALVYNKFLTTSVKMKRLFIIRSETFAKYIFFHNSSLCRFCRT